MNIVQVSNIQYNLFITFAFIILWSELRFSMLSTILHHLPNNFYALVLGILF